METIMNATSLCLGMAMIAGTALLSGCNVPPPVTRTTVTEQTTTIPQPTVSTTTTTMQQTR
jgi:hypothetical protein